MLDFIEENLAPWKRAIHEVLDEWFEAMEDGSAFSRIPDLTYTRPNGKPTWTDEQLENLVCVAIDEYVDQQRSWVQFNRGITTDTHCGFDRLGTNQRIALAQDLERVFTKYDIATGENAPPTFTESIAWG